MTLSSSLKSTILKFQENEITEYTIYTNLARKTRVAENRDLLQRIADDEHRHYDAWKAQTGQDVSPNRLRIGWYTLLGSTLGLTFALKLMERGEEGAQEAYAALVETVPAVKQILADEDAHEEALLGMLDEELLRYTGSIVLGLNDALVELTGALAGLTLALQNTQLIALTASITGIAASMSMAASEYLSTKTETSRKTPGRAALYTGITYVVTVIALILPYLIFGNLYVCLGLSLLVGVLIIAVFNYYVSVVEGTSFRHRFVEMAGLSLTIAALSFGAGYLIRVLFGVDA